MKRIIAVSLLLSAIGCTPTPSVVGEDSQNDVIQGTRIDPADVTSEPTMVLTLHEKNVDGKMTVGELLKQMNSGSWGFPNIEEFAACDDLVASIRDSTDIELVAVTEKSVVARAEEATMIYNYPSGGCNAET